MTNKPTQSAYYAINQLSPSKNSIEYQNFFEQHWEIRTHLYQDLLGIPLAFLKDKSVLEIGCGTGEAALVNAFFDAHLTLIDANRDVESRLDQLFKLFGKEHVIKQKFFNSFDEFETEKKFSLITAEGFLFTLSNREKLLRKICSMLVDGGIAVISFPDKFGTFFEFIKKTVLWRVYQVLGIRDIYNTEALSIAKDLFLESFGYLPSPRKFETWWMDCLVSPFLTWEDCWAYDEILPIIYEQKCNWHSSTPRIFETPYLTWYKKIQNREEKLSSILSSYSSRRFDLLFGASLKIEYSNSLHALGILVSNLLKNISSYFKTLDESFPAIKFHPICKLAADCGIFDPVLEELESLFKILESQDSDEIISAYKRLPHLNSRWGCSYQYLAFRKETPYQDFLHFLS